MFAFLNKLSTNISLKLNLREIPKELFANLFRELLSQNSIEYLNTNIIMTLYNCLRCSLNLVLCDYFLFSNLRLKEHFQTLCLP